MLDRVRFFGWPTARPSLIGLLAAVLLAGATLWAGCDLGGASPDVLSSLDAAAMLPPDAQVVAKLDLQTAQQTPLLPMAMLPGGDSVQVDGPLQDFLDAAGLDPQRDVREAFVAIPPDAGAPDSALALQAQRTHAVVFGRFDPAQIREALAGATGGALSTSSYAGLTVYAAQPPAGGTDAPTALQAFTVASDRLLMAAPNRSRLRAMIDRFNGQGRALRDDARHQTLIDQVAGASTAWLTVLDAATLLPDSIEVGGPGSPGGAVSLESLVQDVALQTDFGTDGGADLALVLRPAAATSAPSLRDQVRLGLDVLSATNALSPEQQALLQAVTVTAEDGFVRLSATLSPEQVDRLLGDA
jgi:hypothetical protein